MTNDGLLARAAMEIADNGFAEQQFGTSSDFVGWNALVVVSHIVLFNIYEDELAEKFRSVYPHAGIKGIVAWIVVNEDGHIHVVNHGDEYTDQGELTVNTFYNAYNVYTGEDL